MIIIDMLNFVNSLILDSIFIISPIGKQEKYLPYRAAPPSIFRQTPETYRASGEAKYK